MKMASSRRSLNGTCCTVCGPSKQVDKPCSSSIIFRSPTVGCKVHTGSYFGFRCTAHKEQDSSSKMALQELILSSSSTLTCLHDLKTGSLQTSFKGTSSSGTSDFSTDPQASSSSTYGNNSNNNSNAKGKNRAVEEEQSSLFKKTTDCIETRDAVGGIVASVIAGKAAINIWSYQKVRTFMPCVTLHTSD